MINIEQQQQPIDKFKFDAHYQVKCAFTVITFTVYEHNIRMSFILNCLFCNFSLVNCLFFAV